MTLCCMWYEGRTLNFLCSMLIIYAKMPIRFLYIVSVRQMSSTHSRVVNGPTRSSPNPARTRKCKPEPGPNPKII